MVEPHKACAHIDLMIAFGASEKDNEGAVSIGCSRLPTAKHNNSETLLCLSENLSNLESDSQDLSPLAIPNVEKISQSQDITRNFRVIAATLFGALKLRLGLVELNLAGASQAKKLRLVTSSMDSPFGVKENPPTVFGHG